MPILVADPTLDEDASVLSEEGCGQAGRSKGGWDPGYISKWENVMIL